MLDTCSFCGQRPAVSVLEVPDFSVFYSCNRGDCGVMFNYWKEVTLMNSHGEITVEAFTKLFNLKFKVEEVDDNPYMSGGMPAGSRHYRCRFRLYPSENPKANRRQMTTYFSKGPAHEYGVDSAELLDCIASDTASIAAVDSAEEYAEDFGEELTPVVRRSYNATVRQANKLHNMFGPYWLDTLLYHTEHR